MTRYREWLATRRDYDSRNPKLKTILRKEASASEVLERAAKALRATYFTRKSRGKTTTPAWRRLDG